MSFIELDIPFGPVEKICVNKSAIIAVGKAKGLDNPEDYYCDVWLTNGYRYTSSDSYESVISRLEGLPQ